MDTFDFISCIVLFSRRFKCRFYGF